MKKDVRILLVGDEGVGKSSLITSLIRDQFIEEVEHVVAEVTIPPEVTPEKVTTHIDDSSSLEEDIDMLKAQIRLSDVICIVYDVQRMETFRRIEAYWLPLIHTETGDGDSNESNQTPVILVGNKIDLRGNDNVNRDLEENVMPIMVKYKEVETCVECSAKSLLNLSEVFYFAQKAVLHPTAPLYDTRDHELKEPCASALKRIFKLCDRDRDGLLNDGELNDFQRRCFNAPLQAQELEGVKDVVRQSTEDGLKEGCLSESGFLYLHKLFIQRGRLETTWAVLRKFGYGGDLKLTDEFLRPTLSVGVDQSVELSSRGIHFLTELFRSFDKDHDSALSPAELKALFATVPPSVTGLVEFDSGVSSNRQGWVTLEGFLAAWVLFTLDYPTQALGCMACLGYLDDNIRTSIKVTRSKKVDMKKRRTQRTVYQGYVIGAKGAGKSSLLRMHIGKADHTDMIGAANVLSESRIGNGETLSVNSVSVNGSEKYLVLREFSSNGADMEVILNQRRLETKCDVVVLLYDSSDPSSFEYVVNLQNLMGSVQVPIMFVATKSDEPPVEQESEYQPEEFTKMLDIPPPASLSYMDDDISELSASIVSVAMNPHANIPATDDDSGLDVEGVIKIGLACAAFAALGFVLLRSVSK
eukprot:CFRG7777T1